MLETHPAFHFETKVDSLTEVKRYKSNYAVNGCLQDSHVRLSFELNSRGNNFQFEMSL